jgi:hypothetical protein
MIKDDDGSIVLDDDDMRGVDSLILALDKHIREKTSYTLQEVSKFVREWEYIRRPHARDEDVFYDDQC